MPAPDYQWRDSAPGTAVRRRTTRRGRVLALLFAVLGLAAIAYVIAGNDGPPSGPADLPQGEEFLPLTAPQQGAFAPPPPPAIPAVVVPAAPSGMEEQAAQADLAPAAPAEPDCADVIDARTARPECIEQDRQRKLLQRVHSSIVVVDGAAADMLGAGAQSTASGEADRTPAQPVATDGDRAFLARMGAAQVETAAARQIRRTDAWIAQGTLIRATLETAINSDLAGMVKAIVRKDVYSFDGRRVLIPAGSSLVGDYKNGMARGQERLFIVWTRMLRGDGVSVLLGSFGTDALGRSGLAGSVDRKYWERLGPPALLTMIGGATQYLAALGNRQNQPYTTIVDAATGTLITVPAGGNGSTANPQQIASQTLAAGIQQLAAEAFKDTSAIQPTIRIDQGSEVQVFVTRDLDFSGLYPDPVRQEFDRMRQARGHR